MMKPPMPQGEFRSPFVFALDRNEDGFIGPEEIARAAKALKAMDLNGDGKIGPAEWKARRGPLPIEMDSRSQDRYRGKQPGRSSVGGDRPVPSKRRKDKARNSEKAGDKKPKE